jgi:hypothetical protein
MGTVASWRLGIGGLAWEANLAVAIRFLAQQYGQLQLSVQVTYLVMIEVDRANNTGIDLSRDSEVRILAETYSELLARLTKV